ncbi:putative permease [Corynebacterium kutscheri]|uniref:Putative permease n=1 Tax=Corynebacterium kutscheri TaxID=35755 RepID=A0A0F6TCF6_9CORY|nr:EamA family transporter [Corynebacterium kutscheri]AKE40346.1 putative permease [Corynebacterium kutscheri]VEH10740.1 carboxylate/amino acid/amine transporter [Corynebacterium kutscheri]
MASTSTSVTPVPKKPVLWIKKIGFIAMFISATGMGLVGTLARPSTPINPNTGSSYIIGDFLAAGRMMVGCLGMLAVIIGLKKLDKLRNSRVSFAVVAGGLSIGISLALYVSSTLMTSIANAVFLIYTGPIFSALLAWIFLKEKISLRNTFFLLLVFLGMLLTIGIIRWDEGIRIGLDLAPNPQMPNKALGDLFGLGSGIFYGLALFFYRYRSDMDSEVRGFYNFIFGAVGAIVVMVFRMRFIDDTNPFTVMQPVNWAWAAVLFVVCGFIAIGSLVVAGKNLLAVELSTVAYWECVVALLLGLFLWNEPISLFGFIGGVLIIIGGLGPVIALISTRKQSEDYPSHIDSSNVS